VERTTESSCPNPVISVVRFTDFAAKFHAPPAMKSLGYYHPSASADWGRNTFYENQLRHYRSGRSRAIEGVCNILLILSSSIRLNP
jgi:hypothetical protein